MTYPSSFPDTPPAIACMLAGAEEDAVSLTPLSSPLGWPVPERSQAGGVPDFDFNAHCS